MLEEVAKISDYVYKSGEYTLKIDPYTEEDGLELFDEEETLIFIGDWINDKLFCTYENHAIKPTELYELIKHFIYSYYICVLI